MRDVLVGVPEVAGAANACSRPRPDLPGFRVTRRQHEVLAFIQRRVDLVGFPPTLSEIAGELGLSHRSTVHSHVQALVRDGHLEARDVRGSTAYFPTSPAAAA